VKAQVLSIIGALALAITGVTAPAAAAGPETTSVAPVQHRLLAPELVGAGEPAQLGCPPLCPVPYVWPPFPFPWPGPPCLSCPLPWELLLGYPILVNPLTPYLGTGLNLFNIGLAARLGTGLGTVPIGTLR